MKETNIALNKMTDLYIEKKSTLKKVFRKVDMNTRINEISKENFTDNNSCLSGISYHSKDHSPSKLSVF
jgi:putative component of toxin-antitoxin plasmid stabilization module